MRKFLLDRSVTGVEHYAHVDHDGEELIIEEFTPTKVESEVLDHAHKLRGLTQNKGRAFRHAATIPIGTHAIWKKEWQQKWSDKWTWPTYLAMKLNSADNKNLRTGVKRL